MVIGLQLPFSSLPIKGMPGKAQSVDSAIHDLVLFGEILKRKEEQLQQEQVSASSIAAALAAMQSQPIVLPLFHAVIEISHFQSSFSADGSPQTTLDSAGNQTTTILNTQTTTARLTPTETSGPVTKTVSNAQADSSQQPKLLSMQFNSLSVAESVHTNFATDAALRMGITEHEGLIHKSGFPSFTANANLTSTPVTATTPKVETTFGVETKVTQVQSPAQGNSASIMDEIVSNHPSTPAPSTAGKEEKQTSPSGLLFGEARNTVTRSAVQTKSVTVDLNTDPTVNVEIKESQPDVQIKTGHAQNPSLPAQQVVGKNVTPEITVPSNVTLEASADLNLSDAVSSAAEIKTVLEQLKIESEPASYENPSVFENRAATSPILIEQLPASEVTTSQPLSATSLEISVDTAQSLLKPAISAATVPTLEQKAGDIRVEEASRFIIPELATQGDLVETATLETNDPVSRTFTSHSSELPDAEFSRPMLQFAPEVKASTVPYPTDRNQTVEAGKTAPTVIATIHALEPAEPQLEPALASTQNDPGIQDALSMPNVNNNPDPSETRSAFNHGATKVEAKPISVLNSESKQPETEIQFAYSHETENIETSKSKNASIAASENTGETRDVDTSFISSDGRLEDSVNVSKLATPVEQRDISSKEKNVLEHSKRDEMGQPFIPNKPILQESSTRTGVQNVQSSEPSTSESNRTTQVEQSVVNVKNADPTAGMKSTETEFIFIEPKITPDHRPVEKTADAQSADPEMNALESISVAQTVLSNDRPTPMIGDSRPAKAFTPAVKPENQKPTSVSNESANAQVVDAKPQMVPDRPQMPVAEEFVPAIKSEFQRQPATLDDSIDLKDPDLQTGSRETRVNASDASRPFESFATVAEAAVKEEAPNQTESGLEPDLQKANNTKSIKFIDADPMSFESDVIRNIVQDEDTSSLQTATDPDSAVFRPATNLADITQPELQETPETIEKPAYKNEQVIDKSVRTQNVNTSKQSFVSGAPNSQEKTPVADQMTMVTERVLDGNVQGQDPSTDVNKVIPEAIGSREMPGTQPMKNKENSQSAVHNAVASLETSTYAAAQPSEATKPAVPEQFNHVTKPVNPDVPLVVDAPAHQEDSSNMEIAEPNKAMVADHASKPSIFEPVPDIASGKQVAAKEETVSQPPLANKEDARTLEKQPELPQTPEITVPVKGPVKAAQGAEMGQKYVDPHIHAQVADVARQVIQQVKMHVKRGTTSMHLQLNPGELGAIEVDMVSSAQGMQVTIFAEHASTGRLLETQLNQLRDSLVDSGVQLSGLNIGQHNTQGQKGGAFSQESNLGSFAPMNFAESKVSETPTVEQTFGPPSEVDYRI